MPAAVDDVMRQPLRATMHPTMAGFLRACCGSGLALLLASGLSGCIGPPVDIQKTLQVTDVTSGWLDVGIDDYGRNKLVPSISFRLTNVSPAPVRTLQLNGVFRRCLDDEDTAIESASADPQPAPDAGACPGEDKAWGSSFIRAVGREGIDPGGRTERFTMDSELGYTGEQPRLDMLRHSKFVDVKVELFVRHRAEQWVRLGEYVIKRNLLTQSTAIS